MCNHERENRRTCRFCCQPYSLSERSWRQDNVMQLDWKENREGNIRAHVRYRTYESCKKCADEWRREQKGESEKRFRHNEDVLYQKQAYLFKEYVHENLCRIERKEGTESHSLFVFNQELEKM